ncbi:MAG: hypothetical protein ABI227_06265 [Rhodanobacter sp.]
MLFDFPKVRIDSIKDFAKHYLMIVLSILTALGLEAWIERAHHQRAAATASSQIEAEIRTNLGEAHTDLQRDVAQLRRLDTIRDAVIRDLKAHVPDDVIKQHILTQTKDHFDLNLNFPTLRHEAWDVVVADQSASWIDQDRMQRYSAAYASQRDITTSMSENTALLMNGTGLVDTIADLGTDEAQPREFLHVISQMTAMLGQTVNSLRLLEKQLDAALPDKTSNITKPVPAA